MIPQEVAPLDLIDFCFMTVGAAYPPILPIAIGQWFLRRSPTVRQWASRTTQRLLLAPALDAPALDAPALDAPTAPMVLHEGDILNRLEQAYHLLVIGGTRGGKTTLMHALARRLHDGGARVLVCDPDSIAGDYGYRCVGAGDDYPAIGQALHLVANEISKRRGQRKLGTRRFATMWVFVDEAHDVVREIPAAWTILEDGIRRGGKLAIHIVLGTHDDQVKSLGLEGKSKLLINLTRALVAMREGERWATVGDTAYLIPQLPSPDDIVKPVYATPQTTETDPLLAQLLEAVSGSLKTKTTKTTETSKPFSETDLNQAIRERLADGESKNKICTWLADTHGVRNKVTALKMINEAIGGNQ